MAKNTLQILRKEGWQLNPDDKVVNGVIKGLDRCKGLCPCYHKTEDEEEIPEEDLKCPCKEYREGNHCRCNLYIVKEPENQINVDQYVATIEDLKEQVDFFKRSLNVAKKKIYNSNGSFEKNESIVY